MQAVAGRLNAPRGPFSVFATLYTVAMILELGEEWRNPWFSGAFVLAAGAAVLTGITRVHFLLLLSAATGYLVFFRFPELANHANLMLLLNVAMSIVMAISLIWRRHAPDEDYEAIAPMLRISLMLIYALAGFHKLNTDYLNTESSCATGIIGSVIMALQTRVLGVPVVVPIALASAVAGYRLLRRGRFATTGNQVFTAVVTAVGVAGLAVLGVVLLQPHIGPLMSAIALTAAVSVLAWEFGGGLLLAVPRLQAAIIAFSLTMHATLALVGFVDFGALAVALLFTFLPTGYRQLVVDGTVRMGRHAAPRVLVYSAVAVAIAIMSGIDAHVHQVPDLRLLTGLMFDAAVVLVIWPLLVTLFSADPRPEWSGVPIIDRRMPVALYLVPVLLVGIALTPYLGLRTAGNFSMFSNLRTEGERSNHLLLASNPLKIWEYQEDLVWILEIDDRFGDVIHHYDGSPRGFALPAVEFRKWVHDWDEAGYRVPLTYGYNGIQYSTEDIVSDPMWHTRSRTPEMMLLDFRVVQPGSPNYCRW